MNFLKRSIAIVCMLSVACCLFFSNVFNTKAETIAQSVMISYPRAGDANDNGKWGHPAQTYLNGWKTGSTNVTTVHTMGSYDGTVVYCVEPGRDRNTGDRYTKYDENFWDNLSEDYNSRLTPVEIRSLLGRVLYYGYQGSVSMDWVSQNSADADKMAYIMATQILVWEVIVGERDIYFDHMDTGSKDPMKEYVQTGHPLYQRFCYYYDVIEKNVKKYRTYPSFFGKTATNVKIPLKWDGTQYSATLVDSNNVVSQYRFSTSDGRVTVKKSGTDTLILTTNERVNNVTITAQKDSARKTVLIWSDGEYNPNSGLQDAITYGANIIDPVVIKMSVETQAGDLQVTKTSEDGKVAGVSFSLSGNGISQSGKTNPIGVLMFKSLPPGTYTVKETGAGAEYITPSSQTVTIKNNETTKVTFQNVLKRGSVKVRKVSEDEKVEGVLFHLKGTSLSGADVDLRQQTNEEGIAIFENVLISGDTPYQLEEENIPAHDIEVQAQDVVVVDKKQTEVQFENHLRRGNLIVKKVSEDENIENISFRLSGVSLSGAEVDEIATTNEEGIAYFENVLVSGENPYVVEELDVDERYVVPDSQVVFVSDEQDVELQFENVLKRFSIFIHKQDEGGNPLQGAQFGLFDHTQKEPIAVCESDKQGDGAFVDILPGDYYVLELKAPKGYLLSALPVEVHVSTGGEDAYITMANQKEIVPQKPLVKNPPKAPDTAMHDSIFLNLMSCLVLGFLKCKRKYVR